MIIEHIEDTIISEIIILTPQIHRDSRGYFFESFNSEEFKNIGLPINFLQDNQVFSKKNTLRGFHYQLKYPQGKLVRVIQGEVFDVAVDIRLGSATFGQYQGFNLSAENNKIVYIPEGFAHGYIVISETAIFQYKCTENYHPEDEYGIIWNDKELNVKWSVRDPILSQKDQKLPALRSIDEKYLPKFRNNE
ncbi:MAG: dTDP-4-dehydrorhamnose 3,5-epimerase [Candidatus Neomarinimicrobiota bacterium]